MKIYRYDETGVFTREDNARKSPLESHVFLIPAKATTIAPPEIDEGYVPVFNGDEWERAEDHRGETVYHSETGATMVMKTAGPLPPEYTVQPVTPPLDKPAVLSAYRFLRETEGITVNGAEIRTDRETQAMLLGARTKAKEDDQYTIVWKAVNGFINLNSVQIITVADTVADHVQKCFAAESHVVLDTCETETDVIAAFNAAYGAL